MNSLPKTVTRQRRGCDLNPGPSAPESSTLTTRLPSHPTPCKPPYRPNSTCSENLGIAHRISTIYIPLLIQQACRQWQCRKDWWWEDLRNCLSLVNYVQPCTVMMSDLRLGFHRLFSCFNSIATLFVFCAFAFLFMVVARSFGLHEILSSGNVVPQTSAWDLPLDPNWGTSVGGPI